MLPALSLSTSNFNPSHPKLTASTLTKSSFHGIRIGFPGRNHVAGGQVSRRAQASPVVMMAKREEELKEIRAKTTDELHEEIIDLKGELFVLRLQKSARADFKNSEFSRMRKRNDDLKIAETGSTKHLDFPCKSGNVLVSSIGSNLQVHPEKIKSYVESLSWYHENIARMLTVKRERELEEGINKRLSRKLDRKWKKSIVFRPPPSLKKMQVEESEQAKEAEKSA